MPSRSSKGQAVVTDVVFTVIIVVALLVSVMIEWNLYTARFAKDVEYATMVIKAQQLTELLAMTPGIPENWTNDTVQQLGLASNSRNISAEKVGNLTLLSTTRIEELLGIEGYNITFILGYSNTTNVTLITENADMNISSNMRRGVIYQNESAVINFIIGR